MSATWRKERSTVGTNEIMKTAAHRLWVLSQTSCLDCYMSWRMPICGLPNCFREDSTKQFNLDASNPKRTQGNNVALWNNMIWDFKRLLMTCWHSQQRPLPMLTCYVTFSSFWRFTFLSAAGLMFRESRPLTHTAYKFNAMYWYAYNCLRKTVSFFLHLFSDTLLFFV
jgi:hypothetical protein